MAQRSSLRRPTLRRLLSLLTVVSLFTLASDLGADEGSAAAQVAMGRSTFRAYCASCHGREGRGDGPVAEHLKVPPADLTRIRERHAGSFPDAEIRRTIDGREEVAAHGTRDMPIWGEAFRKVTEDEAAAERRIDELVAFLKSIQQSAADD